MEWAKLKSLNSNCKQKLYIKISKIMCTLISWFVLYINDVMHSALW